MTRAVTFADSFTSASAPDVATAGQEQYTITNNVSVATSISGLTFAAYTSVFIDFELSREDVNGLNRQSGALLIHNNGTDYTLNLGNYQGDDIVRLAGESIAAPEEIILTITALGQIQYQSGNMNADSYEGTLKLQITRVF